jgi:hypothetical protein
VPGERQERQGRVEFARVHAWHGLPPGLRHAVTVTRRPDQTDGPPPPGRAVWWGPLQLPRSSGTRWSPASRTRQADRVSGSGWNAGDLEDSAERSSADLRRHDLSYWHRAWLG